MILFSSKLDLMAFIVSVIVIFLMTVVFCFLFILNNRLRKRFLVSVTGMGGGDSRGF